ncbi:cupin domain-containing protein [Methylobrevis albus]|uniref:Cupin domain-containing protein n=1 Tax=Methylobrevis albus TaxID=2793297 RepID=A0A931I355_9HYPH|nr:cupin domain-containing protein [Methylobrevis albus]MBH0238018.1 cupin domain-containing protein [Methylobrevis albus]
MTRPILRPADLPLITQAHGDAFEARFAAIAAPLGARRLGARYVEIPPGRKGWPHHCHHANDELFVILGGSGTLRYGEETHAVAAGDVVVCPAGGPETAHQLIAGPTEALRYLAVSSMHDPDVMQYPDSGKVTVFAGAAPGGDKTARRVSLTLRAADAVDYWDGEG